MNYSVAEFRSNMREAFDQAEKSTVFIRRHDKIFMLRMTGDKKAPINIPSVKKDLEDNTEMVVELNKEQKCCKLLKPCQHWQFDGEVWRNSLSGNVREPQR